MLSLAVSIRDVAKSAGVSVSTVSRALNGYTDVNEKTRKKIQITAQRLGYIPNRSAKNLSSKSHKNIAIIISNISKEDMVDEFVGNILWGIYAYANQRKETLATYVISSEMQKDKTLEEMCNEYSLSGILVFGMRLDDPYLYEIKDIDIPCVSIDTKICGKNVTTIATNEEDAFEEIVDYVLDMGHREIVLIEGRDEAEVTHKRKKGFERSVIKHGIDINKIEKYKCNFLEEEAFINTKTYIEKNQNTKGTVFVCMSDLMALGVIRAVKECGYSIPEDFSVTGYDGLYILKYVKPGLTTLDQNIREKGYVGIKTLYEMLHENNVSDTIYVPYKVRIRESVGRIDI